MVFADYRSNGAFKSGELTKVFWVNLTVPVSVVTYKRAGSDSQSASALSSLQHLNLS